MEYDACYHCTLEKQIKMLYKHCPDVNANCYSSKRDSDYVRHEYNLNSSPPEWNCNRCIKYDWTTWECKITGCTMGNLKREDAPIKPLPPWCEPKINPITKKIMYYGAWCNRTTHNCVAFASSQHSFYRCPMGRKTR
jgi:hypothetical protein